MNMTRALVGSCVLLVTVLAEVDKVQRSGLVGHSVKLSCSIPYSQPPVVTWNDRVYSSTPDPILIFQSENNSNFVINDQHPNKLNFKIDENNFELRISNLSSSDSVGEYSCISQSGGETHEKHYFLTVHESLTCMGESQLQDGQKTKLTCTVKYAGTKPSLKWLLEDGHEINSTDRSELTEDGPKGEQELLLTATHDLDDKDLRCRMDFGDKREDCRIHFNITYPVRDIGFGTTRTEFYPGEEIVCTARGNPAPEISLAPTSVEEIPVGRVKSHIIIPKSWEGKEVTMECSANNTYNGKLMTVKKSIAFRVLAATTPTTIKTTPTPTVPGKIVDGGGENSSGDRFSSAWIILPFVMLSLTLSDLLSVRC